MYYKLGKNILLFILNIINFMQVLLIFYSFYMIFYWILMLANLDLLNFSKPLFDLVINFVHLFYQRVVTVDDVTVDFSPLLAAVFMCAISYFCKYLTEFIQFLIKSYDRIYYKSKKILEDAYNKNLEITYKQNELKNNNIILLLEIKAKNLLKDAMYNRDVSVGVDEKIQEIQNAFKNELKLEEKYSLRITQNRIVLQFSDFRNIDSIISSCETLLFGLRRRYMGQKWALLFHAAIGVYSSNEDVMKVFESLKMLIKLNITDEILCQGSFKNRYEINKNCGYAINSKGIYKINEVEENIYFIDSTQKK